MGTGRISSPELGVSQGLVRFWAQGLVGFQAQGLVGFQKLEVSLDFCVMFWPRI